MRIETDRENRVKVSGVNGVTPAPVPDISEEILQRAIDEYRSYPYDAHLRFKLFLDVEPYGTFRFLKRWFEVQPIIGFTMTNREFLGGLMVEGYEVDGPALEGTWSKFKAERGS